MISSCLLLLASLHPGAHDPGLSSATLRVHPHAFVLTVTMNRSDFATLGARLQAGAAVAGGYRLALEGTAVTPADPADARIRDLPPDIEVELHLARPPGSRLEVEAGLLTLLPRGHRQHFQILDAAGRPLAQAMLHSGSRRCTADLTHATAAGQAFVAFVLLGFEHILLGYDHVLFLIALLLVGPSFWRTVGIVTAFTLAHSLTLALAALDVVVLPSTIVEPMIAASIVCVALENLLASRFESRWLVTFVFGLVHGFGFASVLRELGIGQGAAAVGPLLAFNLGVELGQVLIAAVLVPLIAIAKARPAYARWICPACSLAVAGLATWWLLERTLLA